MDLKLLDSAPTDAECDAVDSVLTEFGLGGGEGSADSKETTTAFAEARRRRTALLPALLALQSRVGFVSPGGLAHICARLRVPPAEAFGVASFYALLSLDARPAAFAHVCEDLACQAAGAEALCRSLEAAFGSPATTPHRADVDIARAANEGASGGPCWTKSPCLGLCDQAPAALVTIAGPSPFEQSFGHASVDRIEAALRGERIERGAATTGCLGPRRLLSRAGVADPTSLDAYRDRGGLTALRRALEIGPDAVIEAVHRAKLVGRGGAAFPTWWKWKAVKGAAARPHYVVCNADESEPGTFKDRVLLEEDPFAVLEGLMLAAAVTGAERGYVYVRGEYPLAADRLTRAASALREAGLLGTSFLTHDAPFDVEIRRGAGAYICGEETALFASIEGFRGEPRSKPPYPVESGLFGRPTAVNNVETLVAVLDIVREGAEAYASVGTPDSPGTKLFCVSGRIARSGVYEVPFGTTLGRVLELAGGVPGGRPFRGALLGGAAGGFVGPTQLDLPLSFEGVKASGATLGSGVIFVLDDSVALAPLLRRIAAFFRDESCGQCVPCRVGTVRQEEILARLARGAPRERVQEDLALLTELGQAMRDASICGLGQTASSAVESAIRVFTAPEIFSRAALP